MKVLMTGNEAIARGAWEAGVRVVAAYPGTPSTEITENAAKYEDLYAEWAPNEKVALEVAIGTAVSGGRAMACMKHVGVNVAADPLLTVAFTGVHGGLVLVSADDPGMHSSQNEQDNRQYGRLAKIPVLEPSDSGEALLFTKLAFEISETFDTPVLLRLTTRVAHSQSLVTLGERADLSLKPYEKNPAKFVMIPAHARPRHGLAEERLEKLRAYGEKSALNRVEMGDPSIGVIASGIVYQYVKEALPTASVLKLGLTNPLPAQLLLDFAARVDKLYVIEELDPIIEEHCRVLGLSVIGKALFPLEGEIFPEMIAAKIRGEKMVPAYRYTGVLPPRPPVLCAGCPHRAAFYVMKKLNLHVMGDIGCYTLGCLAPLNSIDTTVCMGASIGMALGAEKVRGRDFAAKTVAVLGDSTFIHSGITALIDTVYNQGATTTVILDNRITAMTGHQQNPLTGRRVNGEPTRQLDLEQLVKGCGIDRVQVVDPFHVKKLEAALKEELAADEPSVIISRRPCALLHREQKDPSIIDQERCKRCNRCLKMGCPAIVKTDAAPYIDGSQCVGCRLCMAICPHGVIGTEEKN